MEIVEAMTRVQVEVDAKTTDSPAPLSKRWQGLARGLTSVMRPLAEVLADPQHKLTLAQRDKLELAYQNCTHLLAQLGETDAGKDAPPARLAHEWRNPSTSPQAVLEKPKHRRKTPVQQSKARKGEGQPVHAMERLRTSPPSARRILIVDDKADVAKSLATLLTLVGHEVKVAHDGPQALKMARSYPAEVVLLDIGLPGMSGYEVAQHLRRGPAGQQLILVAVTGYGHAEDRQRAKEAGFDHYLMKPTNLEVIKKVLAQMPKGISS
jgi:CheY-like chemotaxis protein